jgi:hypothetical protein
MRVARTMNVALRACLVGMFIEVVRAGREDPRYRRKGIAQRYALVGLPAALVAPVARRLDRRASASGSYSVAMDNLFLSVLALDLAGNVLDLYDRHRHFDLIPHAHGTGAATVLAAWLLRQPMPGALGVATIGHILLEAQEYASDVVFGTRNVRGTWDVIGDLLAGVVGSLAYAAAYEALVRRHGREPASPLA